MSFMSNKKVLIITSFCLIIIAAGSLILALHLYINNDSTCETSECICNLEEDTAKISEDISNTFFVEVKGAVVNPGVYEVTDGAIINDLISLAGGFTSKAYTNNINLSKKVKSEMVVYVFTKTEYKNKSTVDATNMCVSNTYNIDNCTNNYSSVITGETNSSVSTGSDGELSVPTGSDGELSVPTDNGSIKENKLININTATKEELMTLPGVGEAKALAIISYRNENGLFKSIEDITKVSGIGASTLEKFKSLITVQ